MNPLEAFVLDADEKRKQAEAAIHRRRMDAARLSRQLREEAGISLREVARRMGVSAMFLCDLERGNRYWTPRQVSKWTRALKPLPPSP